jgi:hypothetical protein
MDRLKALAERRKIRKTLTVACLKERLSASRRQREQALLEKRNQQEPEEKQLLPTHLEQESEANEKGTQK